MGGGGDLRPSWSSGTGHRERTGDSSTPQGRWETSAALGQIGGDQSVSSVSRHSDPRSHGCSLQAPCMGQSVERAGCGWAALVRAGPQARICPGEPPRDQGRLGEDMPAPDPERPVVTCLAPLLAGQESGCSQAGLPCRRPARGQRGRRGELGGGCADGWQERRRTRPPSGKDLLR